MSRGEEKAAAERGRGFVARLRERWRRSPLALTFAVYFAVCLAASTFVAVSLVSALDVVDARMRSLGTVGEDGTLLSRHLFSGPYLYDAQAGELVPASELSFPEEERGTVFLGISDEGGAQGRIAASREVAGASDDGAPVYATMDAVRSGKVKLYDWGLNYTEAATQDEILRDGGEIPVDELPAYDTRQRKLRLDSTAALEGMGTEKSADGGLFSGMPVSNVAYYAMRAERESLPFMLFRFARGIAPLAVYAVFFWVTARRFYRIHLNAPLSGLEQAAARIAEQDLDFHVTETRGREFGALGGAFERMRASLAEAERALWTTAEERKRLNAAFAHDLRTPLTVLKGTLEMVQAEAEAGVPVPPETYRTLGAQVDRLERYAAAMSRAAKLEERELDCEECAPSEVVASLEEECRMLVAARGAGLELTFEPSVVPAEPGTPPVASGGSLATSAESAALSAAPAPSSHVLLDRALVLEAVGNVVNNACAHARRRVGVSLAFEGDVLDVRVTDDGAGFSAEALRRGCEPFYSEAKSSEHFGMGLNIACVLARLHGGDVVLTNLCEPERGACVHVRFRTEGR